MPYRRDVDKTSHRGDVAREVKSYVIFCAEIQGMVQILTGYSSQIYEHNFDIWLGCIQVDARLLCRAKVAIY